jgi:spore germination protein KA/spore germination protein
MRVKVPFNGLIGVFIIEFIVELIRESLLRVPKQIGSAVGIVGAIVIGQAATSAGIFSPILLMIGAISLLASFAVPDYSLMNPFRVLKIILILFTGALGFFGFTLFLTAILIELVSLNSFGVPYMAPFAPFNFYDFIRTFIQNLTLDPKRPHYLRTKNQTKTKH